MLFLKNLLMWGGVGMIVTALSILAYDLFLLNQHRQISVVGPDEKLTPEPRVRWRISLALVLLAWAPLLVALSIIVVPSGMAGVRISQTSGTLAGTLYPGVHFVVPLLESVVLFDTRDQLFTTGAEEDGKAGATKAEPLTVHSKEGLSLGLANTVRYRVDSKRP